MSIGRQIFGGGNSRTIRTAFRRVNFEMFFNENSRASAALSRKEFVILRGTGAFARGWMRRLIRKAPKRDYGNPAFNNPMLRSTGPPKYHTRGFASLKDGIFYEADTKPGTSEPGNVVIGPNILRGTKVKPHTKASGAQLLEEGGGATIRVYRHDTRKRMGTYKTRTAYYRNWPYVEPTRVPAQNKMKELCDRVVAR